MIIAEHLELLTAVRYQKFEANFETMSYNLIICIINIFLYVSSKMRVKPFYNTYKASSNVTST